MYWWRRVEDGDLFPTGHLFLLPVLRLEVALLLLLEVDLFLNTVDIDLDETQ